MTDSGVVNVARSGHQQGLGRARPSTEAGIIRPTRPDKLVRIGARRCTAGARRRRPATPPRAIRYPDEHRDHRRARHAHLRRGPRAHATRSPTRFARPGHRGGRRRRDPLPQPPRLHRRDGRAERSSAPTRSTSTRRSPRPQITDVVEREEPVALVYDEEFPELVDEAGEGRKRFIAWFDGPDKPEDCPILEDLIEEGDDRRPRRRRRRRAASSSSRAARPARRRARRASSRTSLDPAAALFSQDPAARARDDR